MKDTIIHIHLADVHYGSIDPSVQYDILREQFLAPISMIPFNILAIDGDLFDKKFSANSDAVYYAIRFINECLSLTIMKNAIMVMISGTESHEAGQLSLFKDLSRQYPNNVFIVEDIQFIYAFGYKILCIPEVYNKPASYYEDKLKESYDMCFMHGTIVGGVYGANKEKLQSNREPIFSIDSFSSCRGPIISGHVHKAMCLNSYMYYISNPIRYKFGEEDDKGYSICISNDYGHYYQFMPITSFRYQTISLESLGTNDPNMIVKALDQMKSNGIDYIRLDMSGMNVYSKPIVQMLESQYAQDPRVSLIKPKEDKELPVNTTDEILNKYSDMEFLLDPKLDEYTKFVMYINHNKGSNFLTVDDLKKIISGDK